jgi:hypothetical protein
VNGVGNDYNPPDGVTTSREKLLIWGRPGFVGARSIGLLELGNPTEDQIGS